MPKGINPGDLVKAAGSAKGAQLLKDGAQKAAHHKAVDKAFQKGMDKAADGAIGAAFGFATGGGAAALKRARDRRKERRDAADLARQVGGTYSLNVIVGSKRHHVVWLADGAPYRLMPEASKDAGPLAELSDLKHFCGERREPKS